MSETVSSAIYLHTDEFEVIAKALYALQRKNKGNAEKARGGESLKSYTKRRELLEENEFIDKVISHLAEEFS